MDITRREFLQTGSVAAAFVVAGGLNATSAQAVRDGLFPIPPEAYSHPLFSMSVKQFRHLIGQSFSVISFDGRQSWMTLVEVNPLERMANTIGGYYGESFSLIFENRGKDRLPQDIYDLQGNNLPPVAVLLVPTDRHSRQYEVIVNHLTR